MATAEEIQWVQASQAGDRESFGKLVDLYRGTVTGVAYAVLGDFAGSEDAGQDAFLEAWRKLTSLADPAKFAPWICTIAQRRAIDLVRKRKPAAALGNDALLPANDIDVGQQIASAEEQRLVWQTLDDLPETYRETMVLFYRSEQSVRQVAVFLDENEATIRQRLKRGRELLRNELSETIERTLTGTTPSAAFVLAVMGALPGTLQTAAAVSAASGTSGSAKVIVAAAGTAKAGALIGLLGGLGGALLGVTMSWRNAKYQSERQLIILSTLVFLVLTALFLIGLYGLLHGWFGIQTNTQTYAIALIALILGYQVMCGITAIWTLIVWRRNASRANERGEPLLPHAAKFAASQKQFGDRHWTSEKRFLGLPLIDVQFWSPAALELLSPESGIPAARGWLACGNRAYGRILAVGNLSVAPIAIGKFAFGFLTIGLVGIGAVSISTVAIGGIAIGALGFGGFAFGGLAVGAFALGGLAAGYYALGGAAFAIKAALGGFAWSQQYAVGGQAIAAHANDAVAREFFAQHSLFQMLEPMATEGFPRWLVFTFWICLGLTIMGQLLFRKYVLSPSPTTDDGSTQRN